MAIELNNIPVHKKTYLCKNRKKQTGTTCIRKLKKIKKNTEGIVRKKKRRIFAIANDISL